MHTANVEGDQPTKKRPQYPHKKKMFGAAMVHRQRKDVCINVFQKPKKKLRKRKEEQHVDRAKVKKKYRRKFPI